MTSFIIKNDWDDKAWCAFDKTWVATSSPSSHYPENLASRIVAAHPDKERLRIEEFKYKGVAL